MFPNNFRRDELCESSNQVLVTTIREANVPIWATNLWRAWEAKLAPPEKLPPSPACQRDIVKQGHHGSNQSGHVSERGGIENFADARAFVFMHKAEPEQL